MKRLTIAQYRAMTAVREGRVWLWSTGHWAKPHDVRKDVLDRLLSERLIRLGKRRQDGTLSVEFTIAGRAVYLDLAPREVMA